MNIEAVVATSGSPGQASLPADKIELARKKQDSQVPDSTKSAEASKVPPEEILDQIKGLTEDGMYSVRFENDDSANELVVKVVDRESGEVIRQLPPEEVLGMKASLADLRGKLVDTQS